MMTQQNSQHAWTAILNGVWVIKQTWISTITLFTSKLWTLLNRQGPKSHNGLDWAICLFYKDAVLQQKGWFVTLCESYRPSGDPAFWKVKWPCDVIYDIIIFYTGVLGAILCFTKRIFCYAKWSNLNQLWFLIITFIYDYTTIKQWFSGYGMGLTLRPESNCRRCEGVHFF